jgi:hypothetical protein
LLDVPSQDFAASKLRLFVAVGLGVLLINAGASSAFTWYYRKTGAGWECESRLASKIVFDAGA